MKKSKSKEIKVYKFSPNEKSKRVVKAIVALRQLRQITSLVDLSKKIKYSQPSISMVMRGKRDAPASLILKLHQVFNISMRFIDYGKEPIFDEEKQFIYKELAPLDPITNKAINDRFYYIISEIAIRNIKHMKNIPDVCKKIGLQPSALYQLRGNNTKLPPTKYIRALGVHFDASADWILFNEGEMFRTDNTHSIYNLKREVEKIKHLLK